MANGRYWRGLGWRVLSDSGESWVRANLSNEKPGQFQKIAFKEYAQLFTNSRKRMTAMQFVHSVILSSYNRPSMIGKAIRSVRNQTVPNWELFIADDGSNKQTLDVILSEIGDDPRCTFLACPDPYDRPGIRPFAAMRAVARINEAIPLITGDLVHYLPDDDWFTLDRFDAFNSFFDDPIITVAYGKMGWAHDEEETDKCIFPGGMVTNPYSTLDHTQVVHRSHTFDKVGEWPSDGGNFAVDGLFFKALVDNGFGPIYPMPKVVSYHRLHTRNMLKTGFATTHERE